MLLYFHPGLTIDHIDRLPDRAGEQFLLALLISNITDRMQTAGNAFFLGVVQFLLHSESHSHQELKGVERVIRLFAAAIGDMVIARFHK